MAMASQASVPNPAPALSPEDQEQDERQEPPSLVIDDLIIDEHRNQELGYGAYGSVYKATWKDIPVAAKKLNMNPHNPTVNDDLLRECRLLARLQHPGIMQLFGIYYPNNRRNALPLMITERLHETLRERYFRKPCLTLIHVVDIANQIAAALHFLHDRPKPIIHRDISSTNIMMVYKDQCKCKLVDLGLAKVFAKHSTSKQTERGGPYIPGKVCLHLERYDERLDVFGLGVVTLEILTGRSPNPADFFKSGGLQLMPEAERREKDLSKINLRHPLRPLILSMLEPQEQRPTAKHIHRELLAIIDSGLASEWMSSELQQEVESRQQFHTELVRNVNNLEVQVSTLADLRQQLQETHQQQDDLRRREERLLQRAQELTAREQEVESRHSAVQRFQEQVSSLARQRDEQHASREADFSQRARTNEEKALKDDTEHTRQEEALRQQEFLFQERCSHREEALRRREERLEKREEELDNKEQGRQRSLEQFHSESQRAQNEMKEREEAIQKRAEAVRQGEQRLEERELAMTAAEEDVSTRSDQLRSWQKRLEEQQEAQGLQQERLHAERKRLQDEEKRLDEQAQEVNGRKSRLQDEASKLCSERESLDRREKEFKEQREATRKEHNEQLAEISQHHKAQQQAIKEQLKREETMLISRIEQDRSRWKEEHDAQVMHFQHRETDLKREQDLLQEKAARLQTQREQLHAEQEQARCSRRQLTDEVEQLAVKGKDLRLQQLQLQNKEDGLVAKEKQLEAQMAQMENDHAETVQQLEKRRSQLDEEMANREKSLEARCVDLQREEEGLSCRKERLRNAEELQTRRSEEQAQKMESEVNDLKKHLVEQHRLREEELARENDKWQQAQQKHFDRLERQAQQEEVEIGRKARGLRDQEDRLAERESKLRTVIEDERCAERRRREERQQIEARTAKLQKWEDLLLVQQAEVTRLYQQMSHFLTSRRPPEASLQVGSTFYADIFSQN